MSAISSTKNDKIKHLRKLYSTRQRKQKGQYVLEGSRIIRQAVRAGERLEELFMTPDFAGTEQGQALRTGLARDQQLYFITEDLLKQVSDTVNPQGVIGVVAESNKHRSLTEFDRVVVLDRIQDPGNMGTIIRTAVAAGFDGVIALKGSVDVYNLKVIRATAGAIFSIPVINRMELNELKDLITRVEPRVIAALPDADREYTEIDYSPPLAVVIGNEAHGLASEVRQLAETGVSIPIYGQIESLNASVAAGIILYHSVANSNQ